VRDSDHHWTLYYITDVMSLYHYEYKSIAAIGIFVQ